MDLIVLEVGTRGYPSRSVIESLKRLGFHSKHLSKIVKNVGRILMEYSFYIWLHKNSKDWIRSSLTNSSNISIKCPQQEKENQQRNIPNPKKSHPSSISTNYKTKASSAYTCRICQQRIYFRHKFSPTSPECNSIFWCQHTS